MRITRDLILENFEEKDIKEILLLIEKLQKTLNYYIKNKPELYIQYLDLMNENEKNLIFKGELSDELIQYNLQNKTNNDKEFTKKDGTKILDVWQTTFKLMILKISTEFSTIVDLNRYEIFNLKYNPKATSIKTKNDKPISDPDFILNVSKFSDKEQEQYFLELKSYIAKDLKDIKDKLIFKESQFNKFKKYHDEGKKIIILHKYYLNNSEILYRFFDFEETFSQGRNWFETDMQYKNKGKYYQMIFTYLKPFKEFYQDLSDKNEGLVKNRNGKYISLNKTKSDLVFCK